MRIPASGKEISGKNPEFEHVKPIHLNRSIVREYRVHQQVTQPINHMREKSGKNPFHQQANKSINHIMREIREKSCLAEGKLQAGNMYTNNALRFSGNIKENYSLETDKTSESRNSGKIPRLAKGIIQPVYG
jgi:hypothetical protein